MAKLVSKVYGDALFSLALEEDRLDEIWDEVKGLQAALEAVSYTHLDVYKRQAITWMESMWILKK